ncbi:cullin-4A [Trichonephila clavipes]|nr:cullin-4A [Trichonephila clavipes]
MSRIKRPPVGVVGMFGKEMPAHGSSSSFDHVTNHDHGSVIKSSRVVEQCDVNIHSFSHAMKELTLEKSIDFKSVETQSTSVGRCGTPLRHGSTLNSRRAASPLVRLVEGEERWEVHDHPQDVLPQNWDETELNCSVTCMMLKVTAHDRRTSSPLSR